MSVRPLSRFEIEDNQIALHDGFSKENAEFFRRIGLPISRLPVYFEENFGGSMPKVFFFPAEMAHPIMKGVSTIYLKVIRSSDNALMGVKIHFRAFWWAVTFYYPSNPHSTVCKTYKMYNPGILKTEFPELFSKTRESPPPYKILDLPRFTESDKIYSSSDEKQRLIIRKEQTRLGNLAILLLAWGIIMPLAVVMLFYSSYRKSV